MAKIILMVAANPADSTLRMDIEVREIENGFKRAKRESEFEIKTQLAARSQDIRRAMLDLRPNIVHFCGHGSGERGIVFVQDDGTAKLVNDQTLSNFFELFADSIECVVLNACFSECQAQAIAKHIKVVIGMSDSISDKAAIAFTVAFYDAIGAGESYEFAYRLACNAIQWAGLQENLTPVLFLREEAGNKERFAQFKPPPPHQTPAQLKYRFPKPRS